MTKKKVVFKKLKAHDTIWHADSKIVFRSKKDRTAIGQYDKKTKEITPFSRGMIEICESYDFIIRRISN